ncbi:P-loop containing nucleoside triphosphate hydrolase protein [Violaceomyces palustris]|uniref:P-loop containing nucleoside triphosphate hydrolase protein n=1 Tax=Violaceomyces palustris TaxID=1673888 RepID=A0ACD0P519_9BASI|nr:P-loop containing nucleoside triphosphate hydrolase protein [Violaceomyces palustris]
MDPLLKPGAGGKVGSGSDLEGGDDDDEEEEEDDVLAAIKQSAKKAEAMDEDEEEDPLDAFMNSVKSEVKQVDEEDKKKLAKSGKDKGKALSTLTGEEYSSGEEEKVEEDELDKVGTNAEDLIALAAKKIKKKDLPPVDHSKIDYEPFRKEFYHPPAEVAEMSEEQAEVLRLELDAITVRGKDCPKPLTKWSHCGLPASCLDVIRKLGYAAPTAIQTQAIPAIMSGRDVIGVAKTGSGKTMAFLLPMFRHIKDQRPVESLEGPIGVIMTPTRELAVQIYRESKPFLKALGLRAACVYGGAPISEQIAEMKKTAEIVVATPGRLIDLLTANSGRVTNLRRTTYLVLDEADRMFDMGFEPQVMKIVNNIRPDRQTVLFSATFPKQMESLARKVLRNKPLEITVGGRSVVAAEIEQIVEVREEETKFNRLLEILGEAYNLDKDARTLIFVDRQEAADELLKDLIKRGYVTMSLHGGKEQVDRDQTISDFKAGIVPIVTATSVAARGLDVKQLKLVINYDCPNHMEDYVHRAGRTGRAGNKGTCITFITPQQDRYAKDIVAALKASKVSVPPELEKLLEGFKEKLAAGKAQAAGSGFGGKGLERLETDREKALKAQRSAYGEGGEGEDGKGADAQSAGEGKPAKAASASDEQLNIIQSMNIEIMQGAAPDSVRENKHKAEETSAAKEKSKADEKDEEREAKAAASLKASQAALEAAKARGADTTKLQKLIEQINAQAEERREAQRQAQESQRERKHKDPDATDYHAIVPINDFPQKARWRVTNKEAMVNLIATTGASITNKGVYYPDKTEPQPGDPPKLQLLIESNNKSMVEDAVREIKRLLVEATQAALEAEARNPGGAPGRYSVV